FGIPEHLAGQIAAFVGSLRRLDLRQRPSVAHTLEWARTLLALGAQDLDAGLAAESLPALLRFRADLELAAAELAAGRLAGGWPVQQPRKSSTACMHRTSDGVPKWSTPRTVTSRASGSAATRRSPGPAGSCSPSTTSTGPVIPASSVADGGR